MSEEMKRLLELLDIIEKKIKRNKIDYHHKINRYLGVACISWGNLKEEEKKLTKKRIEEVLDLYNSKF